MAEWPPLRSIFDLIAVGIFSFLQSSLYSNKMITRKAFASVSALYSMFFFPFASCHMEMSWPYPIRSKYNLANSYEDIDYSMTSPLNADGSNFPCKGYQNDRPMQTTISYTAGSTYNMTLAGSATHGGGSCQLSLSYDNGATFRVIKSMIGGCPLTSTYDFTIPTYVPSGVALFAWTWQNLVGDREYYMNCAEVNIISGTYSRRKTRQAYSSFDQLPFIWKANLDGINQCVTTEGVAPVYPNPGPDVDYGDGMTRSSSPSPGVCDSPTPYGQTYHDLSDSSQPAPPPVEQQNTSTAIMPTTYPTFSYAPLSTTDGYSSSSSFAAYPLSLDANANQRQAVASQSYTTTTISTDCQATVTVTVYPNSTTTSTITMAPSQTYYTTVASACTGTSASCPCATNHQCQELSPCTWACNPYNTPTTLASSPSSADYTTPATLPSSPSSSVSSSATASTDSTQSSQYVASTSSSVRSTFTVISTHTVTPVQPTSSSMSSPTGYPPYATGNVERYLPCVPGTFICTSNTTWDTCDYDDGSDANASSTSWVYDYPRNVSAGMECITFLSPYSNQTSQYAQQALTPNGYFRDDRVVRARPDGDCNDDGSIKCTDNGDQFELCDQGRWVEMGIVANGTTCSNGQIIASN